MLKMRHVAHVAKSPYTLSNAVAAFAGRELSGRTNKAIAQIFAWRSLGLHSRQPKARQKITQVRVKCTYVGSSCLGIATAPVVRSDGLHRT